MTNTSIYPKIEFSFNKDWELQNWYDTCKKESIYGLKTGNKWNTGDIPQEAIDIISKDENKEKILNNLRGILQNFIKDTNISNKLKSSINRANENWNKISSEYFNLLSKMLNVPVQDFNKQYYAFFTFSHRCPFSNNSFMFNRFGDITNTAAHEIMHIEFLKKYKNYCKSKGLSEDNISHLKEILTVLLNEDMKNILFRPDHGYEKHQEIRPRVLELYKGHKKTGQDFIIFLDKVINLVKDEKQ